MRALSKSLLWVRRCQETHSKYLLELSLNGIKNGRL